MHEKKATNKKDNFDQQPIIVLYDKLGFHGN